jgi:hypothetical protein
MYLTAHESKHGLLVYFIMYITNNKDHVHTKYTKFFFNMANEDLCNLHPFQFWNLFKDEN